MLREGLVLGNHCPANVSNDGEEKLSLRRLSNHVQTVFNKNNTPQLKLSSMGLKSGEYGGRKTNRQPPVATLDSV
jgi:hypothetical protein